MKEKKEFQSPEFDKAAELSSLIRRSQEGDSLAIEAIYEQYKRPLFSLAYRYTYDSATAEDLLQEIFIKVFTHLKDIQRVETFPGWLYRIAVNTCYSYLRQNKTELQKKVPLSEVEAEMKQPEGESPESYLKKPLDEAIEVLPKKLKSVFLLHDVQGFKHHEISRMLGCSVGTSKSQLFKASSVSGSIRYQGKINPDGRYSLKTTSGQVEMTLPSDSSFELEADTFSGHIDSDFPIEISGKIVTREFHGVVNKGGARISLSSFSGNIKLRKS